MADPLNPLTEKHYQNIQKGIDDARAALQAADKAQMAGIDVTAVRASATDTLNRLLSIKQVYFPGRP